ncbi:hypothetical protein [Mycolicibacterium sp. CR10]|uniref:hypothetical protein n=1 Tax=Mycolicibacterium sp. CR10 TaxID=2562314 RepID=UPI001F10327B|nr:hypothetical protein [Mycolicibacterium sp. CR10]
MDTNNVVWIVVAVLVALVVIGLAVFAARKAGNRRRSQEADRIRAEVDHESQRVEKRAALVEETEAKARAAKAEAEAKAAEAARLAETAATHRDSVTTSREDLAARREEADDLDPRTPRTDEPGTAGPGSAERMQPDASTR